MTRVEADLAVIGGGPAGLAAAIEAKKTGVGKVIILERSEQLGGLLYQCIHNGFGLQYFNTDLSGPEYAQRFLNVLAEMDIATYLETMVIGISPKKEITALTRDGGILVINSKSIVLAMGCRERPRGAINISGSRPAGIFTAGSAQRYINVEGYFPGKRIVILGSGDIGMIMARRVTLENAKVEAVIELLPYIGGLIRNECQCLRDFNIPVHLSHTVTKVYGNERVEAVEISEVDQDLNPISGTEKKIECDTLLLSVGLIPENELSKLAGIELCPIVGGPVVDENMQTSIPGIFAAGNVVHVHDLVDYVTLAGERAGLCAAKFVLGSMILSQRKIKVTPGENIRYVVPQYISDLKDVTLYMRVKSPADAVSIKVGEGLIEKRIKNIKPSEMIKIDIKEDMLSNYRKTELRVDCISEKIAKNRVELSDSIDGVEVICLTCPMACRGKVCRAKNGDILKTQGYRCKRGEEFAIKEIKNPERVLTATVRTKNSNQPLLPVRSDKPISKGLLKECMRVLGGLEIEDEVKLGQVVMKNILNTGVDIVASLDYDK
jgi:NADPH-dependent 2,4-dienoyl-CoA reductase/sulfur reductase-like enzyme/CxxC motif-containing protein